MVHALLICSDDGCENVIEAIGEVEELEALACDCGCALEIVGWPDAVPEDAEPRSGTWILA